MVGTYYKKREEREQNKFLHVLSKYVIRVFVLLLVVFLLILFFFNGERIKGPLSAYLSQKFDAEVSIGTADFSPLYPDVMRLSDVRIGSSQINELYIEYDIFSALSEKELLFQDLYINGLTLDQDDWLKFKKSALGFDSIRVDVLRLNHIPLHLPNLQSTDANLRLTNASYNKSEGLNFEEGTISALEASLYNEKVKNFGLQFKQSKQGFIIKDLSVNIFGGTVSGSGVFHPTNLNELLNTPNTQAEKNRTLSYKDLANAQNAANTPNLSNLDNLNTNQEKNLDTGAALSSGLNLTQNKAVALQKSHSSLTTAGRLELNELYLSKIIMPENMMMPGNVEISAKKAVLSDVILTNQTRKNLQREKVASEQNADTKASSKQHSHPQPVSSPTLFVLQGINGQINDFALDQGALIGSFNGEISEMSLPELQTVFEKNTAKISFTQDNIDFELQGFVYEGKYHVRGNYAREQNLLTLKDLLLEKNKLELTAKRWKFLQNNLLSHQLHLDSLSFNDLEFLSYMNNFPVSVQKISGNAAKWKFNNPQRIFDQDKLVSNVNEQSTNQQQTNAHNEQNQHKGKLRFNIEGNPAALLNLELTNVLYSDLVMRNAQCLVTLSDDIINISIPTLKFNESSLSAQATVGLVESNANSYFIIKAKDFDLDDLNSNLIDHLLAGTVDLNVELQSHHDSLEQAFENLEGKIELSSDAMLISDFGLDLINGGPKKDYSLTSTELLTAIQGSVAGINDLKLDIDFADHQAKIQGNMKLATGFSNFKGNINLQSGKSTGQAMISSLAQDSTTSVNVSGTWQEPLFDIVAIKRGEQRPGLYLPQYEGVIAKEPTDTILHGYEDYVIEIPQDEKATASESKTQVGPSEQNDKASSQANGDTLSQDEKLEQDKDNSARTNQPNNVLDKQQTPNSTTPNAQEASVLEGQSEQAEHTQANTEGTAQAKTEGVAQANTKSASQSQANPANSTQTKTDSSIQANGAQANAEGSPQANTESTSDAQANTEGSTQANTKNKSDTETGSTNQSESAVNATEVQANTASPSPANTASQDNESPANPANSTQSKTDSSAQANGTQANTEGSAQANTESTSQDKSESALSKEGQSQNSKDSQAQNNQAQANTDSQAVVPSEGEQANTTSSAQTNTEGSTQANTESKSESGTDSAKQSESTVNATESQANTANSAQSKTDSSAPQTKTDSSAQANGAQTKTDSSVAANTENSVESNAKSPVEANDIQANTDTQVNTEGASQDKSESALSKEGQSQNSKDSQAQANTESQASETPVKGEQANTASPSQANTEGSTKSKTDSSAQHTKTERASQANGTQTKTDSSVAANTESAVDSHGKSPVDANEAQANTDVQDNTEGASQDKTEGTLSKDSQAQNSQDSQAQANTDSKATATPAKGEQTNTANSTQTSTESKSEPDKASQSESTVNANKSQANTEGLTHSKTDTTAQQTKTDSSAQANGTQTRTDSAVEANTESAVDSLGKSPVESNDAQANTEAQTNTEGASQDKNEVTSSQDGQAQNSQDSKAQDSQVQANTESKVTAITDDKQANAEQDKSDSKAKVDLAPNESAHTDSQAKSNTDSLDVVDSKNKDLTSTQQPSLNNRTTHVELKQSDSINPATPTANQSIVPNMSIKHNPNTAEEQKKKADAIENNLLEQAAFESFFNFQDQDLEDAERRATSEQPKKPQSVFKFNNEEDEQIF